MTGQLRARTVWGSKEGGIATRRGDYSTWGLQHRVGYLTQLGWDDWGEPHWAQSHQRKGPGAGNIPLDFRNKKTKHSRGATRP